MRPLFLVGTLVVLGVVSPVPAVADDAAANFLQSHGYRAAPLKRVGKNFLVAPSLINGQQVELLIDTGASNTAIDRNMERVLGISVRPTGKFIRGSFGTSFERFGGATIARVSIGNCELKKVPVAVFNINERSEGAQAGRVAGLLGGRTMRRYGMVIDCARGTVFINQGQSTPEIPAGLAGILRARGYSRIPMRVSATGRFETDAAINGIQTTLLIDTGAYVTCIDETLAKKAGVPLSGRILRMSAVAGRPAEFRLATVRSLNIATFRMNNVELLVTKFAATGTSGNEAGLLGAEYLILKSAIIDCGGMALYLKN